MESADELVPTLKQSIIDDTVVIIDCPVDYSEKHEADGKVGGPSLPDLGRVGAAERPGGSAEGEMSRHILVRNLFEELRQVVPEYIETGAGEKVCGRRIGASREGSDRCRSCGANRRRLWHRDRHCGHVGSRDPGSKA